MAEDVYQPSHAAFRRGGVSGRAVLGLVLLAFLGGGLLIGWLAWDGRLLPGSAAPPPARIAALPAPGAAASDAGAKAELSSVEQRMAGLEQRLARIDLQAAATEGNTSRAEAVLVALATRRAIERGVKLGYLEEQLKLRFADAQPRAVMTVIQAARQPASLEQVAAELDRLAPALTGAAPDESGWDRFTREVSQLFVIRKASTASSAPAQRLERARLLLRAGKFSESAAEVERLPGAAAGKDWIAAVRRHDAAMAALDLIETTALLEPTRLNSADGKPVVQPSPLAPNAAAKPSVGL